MRGLVFALLATAQIACAPIGAPGGSPDEPPLLPSELGSDGLFEFDDDEIFDDDKSEET